LFLPAASPDLHPIEPAWSKLRTLLRGLGARSASTLRSALRAVIDAITPAEAYACFRHCG
jgi:transposase